MSRTTHRSAEADDQHIDHGSVRWVLRRSQQAGNLRGVRKVMRRNNGNARNLRNSRRIGRPWQVHEAIPCAESSIVF